MSGLVRKVALPLIQSLNASQIQEELQQTPLHLSVPVLKSLEAFTAFWFFSGITLSPEKCELFCAEDFGFCVGCDHISEGVSRGQQTSPSSQH